MASNPKLPDFPDVPPRSAEHQHGKVQMIKQNKFPWPIVILIAGAALLVAIFALLPTTSHMANPPANAVVPQQPTAEQIQLTNMKIATAPAGGAVYLTGILHNTGDTAITGVTVEAEFLGRNGPILETLRAPVQGFVGGAGATTVQDLTQAPIRPNEPRPIRIYFDHVPRGWNHQLPQLTVTAVTGTTP